MSTRLGLGSNQGSRLALVGTEAEEPAVKPGVGMGLAGGSPGRGMGWGWQRAGGPGEAVAWAGLWSHLELVQSFPGAATSQLCSNRKRLGLEGNASAKAAVPGSVGQDATKMV